MIDFTLNVKQKELFNLVVASAEGLNPYREIAYGGAIRGGKTYGTLGVLVTLSIIYPGSKWAVFRKDNQKLKETTIPSLEKIIGNSPNWKWNRSSPTFVEHKNGSKIMFMDENIERDPELNGLLGLEINGAVLEQAEELSIKLYTTIKSRLGSWIIPRMPKPLLLFTFNPCQTWIKEMFYDPHRIGDLKAPKYYIPALPTDNPTVTNEQFAMWETLDDKYKRQFVEGDWTNMVNNDDLWAWAFDRKKHCYNNNTPIKIEADKNQYLYISFDFNANPITCIIAQSTLIGQIDVIESIKLANSDIYKLCEVIKQKYQGYLYIITGDASGSNRSAMVADDLNYYKIIKKELKVAQTQIKVGRSNPRLADNQVLVNSILSKGNVRIDLEKNKALLYDLENVRMWADGSIIKQDRTDTTQQADTLDCFRYLCNTFHHQFTKLHIS